ncbi:Transcription factor FAMA [Linum perenne]
MDNHDNYSASFTDQHYSPFDHHHHHHHELLMKPPPHPQMLLQTTTTNEDHNSSFTNMDHFMFNNNQSSSSASASSSSIISPGAGGFDKLMSFADVMQFADFGPKHHDKTTNNNTTTDPVYFLKFPVLNDRINIEDDDPQLRMISLSPPPPPIVDPPMKMLRFDDNTSGARVSDTTNNNMENTEVQMEDDENKKMMMISSGAEMNVVEGGSNKNNNNNNKRKRARSVKTSEEVESQRMTHIAVERNRRKQMNEHLRVLRSLMPGSYVQRGDQASIIGGAIEFVRELEQLLQCLESQKRRRLYGDQPPPPPQPSQPQPQSQVPFFPQQPLLTDNEVADGGGLLVGVREESSAENKSCLADVEVKVLGLDAMIKVLSRRRPGQLIHAIAALEDLQLTILHTNITTIEQTVLFSFNVKVGSEPTMSTAEEIAASVQQIFTFIHTNGGGGTTTSM